MMTTTGNNEKTQRQRETRKIVFVEAVVMYGIVLCHTTLVIEQFMEELGEEMKKFHDNSCAKEF